MEILSHRGIGFGEKENSLESFKKALDSGFGLEIDIRLGVNGKVVISHDPPAADTLTWENAWPVLSGAQHTVAVHLKEQSEAVWKPVCESIASKRNFFLFDPTTETAKAIKKAFKDAKLAFSVGEEHFAPTIYLLDEVLTLPDCDYIWWDEWSVPGAVYNREQLDKIRAYGKKIYVISPELHKATNPAHQQADLPELCWKQLLEFKVDGICTDLPVQLADFIKNYGKNVL
jgi:glycerophosphoryl diester phosphodiesterase